MWCYPAPASDLVCAAAQANFGLQKLVMAAFGLQYGLMMVIICGAELFTGNTMYLTAAFWERKATAGQVIQNWVISYTGALQLRVLRVLDMIF